VENVSTIERFFPMRVVPPIDLTLEQQDTLEQCARARSLPVRLVERARIVLLAAAGKPDKDIAADLGITAQKAARWRKRFLALGMAGLDKDGPQAQHLRRQSEASDSKNNAGEAGPSNPLVHAIHGRCRLPQRGHGAADLAQQRAQASSGRDV
jgi:hypothetical protein